MVNILNHENLINSGYVVDDFFPNELLYTKNIYGGHDQLQYKIKIYAMGEEFPYYILNLSFKTVLKQLVQCDISYELENDISIEEVEFFAYHIWINNWGKDFNNQ